jgi:hypothetical protein
MLILPVNSEEHIREKLRALLCEDFYAILNSLDSKSPEDRDIETITEGVSLLNDMGDLRVDRELVWRKVFENYPSVRGK